MIPVRVRAPQASVVVLVRFDASGIELESEPLRREGEDWVGEVADGTVYGLVAEGEAPRFDASKMLLDPRATAVWFPPGHDRQRARRRGVDTTGTAPVAVARAPRPARPSRRSTRAPVVYEAHVRGLTKGRNGPLGGTYAGLLDELPRLAELGVTVIELLPVHQSDPQEGSYWGYMPLAFGAVERRYAAGDDAAGELAELVAAAHALDIEVWLDVVFNHTTEVDETGPTYSLRGLSDGAYYRLRDDGSYIETTGCGNDLDVRSSAAQDLVVWSLDVFADLGIDGFRFDLASVIARDEMFIARLGEWAARRGVVMVAEPWDAVGTHQVGRAWPGRGWLQWNDRFREDARGFLRSEEGLAEALSLRLQGSPDMFDAPMESVNFVTCHDGFTLYDLVAFDRKHNEANGHANQDGSGANRSWNCGWEGDLDVPEEVVELRHRQLRNAWCLLAMAHGVPMATMGDELGRTQGGNNNAYNQDNETSWVDWSRAAGFADLERFVGLLLALRHRHPVLSQPEWWGDAVQFHGTNGPADLGPHARALAWSVGDLYVIANAWWEPLEFWLQRPGPWQRVVDTSLPSPDDIVEHGGDQIDQLYDVGPRSVVILERPR